MKKWYENMLTIVKKNACSLKDKLNLIYLKRPNMEGLEDSPGYC